MEHRRFLNLSKWIEGLFPSGGLFQFEVPLGPYVNNNLKNWHVSLKFFDEAKYNEHSLLRYVQKQWRKLQLQLKCLKMVKAIPNPTRPQRELCN